MSANIAPCFFPHCLWDTFYVENDEVIAYTRFYYGAMHYLRDLRWALNDGAVYVVGARGAKYAMAAFPAGLPECGDDPSGKRVFAGPEDRFNHEAAYSYLMDCMSEDLAMRASPLRVETFRFRLRGVAYLYEHLYGALAVAAPNRAATLAEWGKLAPVQLRAREWSPEQREVLDTIAAALNISDENVLCRTSRALFIGGEPGSGKSEVLCHAAHQAACQGIYVLILCPTGALVHAYKDRVPESPFIVVETIHSGFAIYRNYDKDVEYCPPTRLRRYGLIIIDEASQIDDSITRLLFQGLDELPQKPMIAVAADFQQLNPVAGGSAMRRVCQKMPQVNLKTIYRTKDPGLLGFLSYIRKQQPSRAMLTAFFQGRHFCGTLEAAVKHGLWLAHVRNTLFVWLCVTNPGAERINRIALSLLGITEADLASGYRGDPKTGSGRIYAARGLCMRLSRNLDKARGFVNGAVGYITKVLDPLGHFFIVKLTTGVLVLVHPIRTSQGIHLPCGYGVWDYYSQGSGQHFNYGWPFL